MPAPDADAVRATIERYLERFSAGDREGWLDLWADGATMEDPVGSPPKRGREEIGAFWDQNRAGVDSIELRGRGIVVVVGNEASFVFDARPTLGGATLSMPVIDVMTFDDEARITSQRAFVDGSLLGPATD